jgi:hypothetical protein
MEASKRSDEQQQVREEALRAREQQLDQLNRHRIAMEDVARRQRDIAQGNLDVRKELADLKSKGSEPLGDYSLAGDEYLNSVDPKYRDTIRGLSDYSLRPTDLTSRGMGTNEKNAILNAVMHYKRSQGEEWRSTEANEISDSVKTFNRAHGDNVRTFNTALGHAQQLERLYVALKSNDPVSGTLLRALATAMGKPDYTNVDALADLVGGEFTKAVVGNMSVGAEREKTRKYLESKRGMEQQIGALREYRGAAAIQLRELKRMFTSTTDGKVDFDKRLSPDALEFARASPGWIEGRGETGMVGAGTSTAPTALPATPVSTPTTIKSKAEYDALPHGAEFIKDGKRWRKP